MVDIMQFVEEVKNHIESNVYPYFFPESASDNCVIVNFNEVLGRRGTVHEMTCSFLVRNTHPQSTLDLCQQLKDSFDKKTDLMFENVQIILMTALNEAGQFQGVDEENRYIFKIDFKILSTRTDILN